MAKLTVPIEFELTPASKELLALFNRLQGSPTETATDAAKPVAATTPPAPGEYWQGQGGYYICTLPALQGLPARHLIVGKDEKEDVEYGPRETITGADSHIDGAANTAALLASGKTHPAAAWAKAYTADSHTDFFLPSRLDLFMAFICARQLFKTSGWYWTSTQGSSGDAFVQNFEGGLSLWGVKDYDCRVRAVRVIQL